MKSKLILILFPLMLSYSSCRTFVTTESVKIKQYNKHCGDNYYVPKWFTGNYTARDIRYFRKLIGKDFNIKYMIKVGPKVTRNELDKQGESRDPNLEDASKKAWQNAKEQFYDEYFARFKEISKVSSNAVVDYTDLKNSYKEWISSENEGLTPIYIVHQEFYQDMCPRSKGLFCFLMCYIDDSLLVKRQRLIENELREEKDGINDLNNWFRNWVKKNKNKCIPEEQFKVHSAIIQGLPSCAEKISAAKVLVQFIYGCISSKQAINLAEIVSYNIEKKDYTRVNDFILLIIPYVKDIENIIGILKYSHPDNNSLIGDEVEKLIQGVIDKRLGKTVEKPSQPIEKYDNIIGIGNLGYSIKTGNVTGTFLHLSQTLGKQGIFSFSLYGAKYKRLNRLNYSLNNWGDRTTNYNYTHNYNNGGNAYIGDSRLDTNLLSFRGENEINTSLWGLIIPSFQVNLCSFPRRPVPAGNIYNGIRSDGFNVNHSKFVLSAYFETLAFELMTPKLGFPYYKKKSGSNSPVEYTIKDSTDYSFIWSFFKSYETGLRLESSLFYINVGYFLRLPSTGKYIQNSSADKQSVVNQGVHGGKTLNFSRYSYFFVTVGLNCDFFN